MPSLPTHTRVELAEVYSSSICAMDYLTTSADRPRGSARFRGLRLQCVDIYMDEDVGRRDFVRTSRHISEDCARDFVLSMTLNGRSYLLQSGVRNCCQPGRSRLLSMAQPFVGASMGDRPGGSFAQLLIRVPGALLRRDIPGVDGLSNTLIDVTSGPGKIMTKMVELGLAEAEALTPKQRADFGNMLLLAIENAIVASLPNSSIGADKLADPKERLLQRAIDFIDANLSNPQLTCRDIAAHCKVSTRSVQAAFASSLGTTAVAYVREKRLEMCMRDISDSAQHATSITNIALRWGFESPSAFTRAYKVHFGRSPSTDKRVAKMQELIRRRCNG